jgi:Ca2+-binding EF-hand superfamily protein
MLKRFDRNGNNMIDPEEAQGPAQFFLQRLAQNNPKIDLKKPVPIDLLTSEMDRMRGGGDSSQPASAAESKEPELLVPDFRLKSEPLPIEGFGSGSSLFNVKVEERDLKEAEDRLKRYDSNKDGVLSEAELKAGRWSDDPLQYDRNRDGKLSVSEMAVRYANRRLQDQERRTTSTTSSGSSNDSRGGWSRRGEASQAEAPAPIDRFGDAKSYRSTVSAVEKVSGLPDFFARCDVDGDGQVTMNEFSSSWNQETLDEFLKWDLNRDGIILPRECVDALAAGARVSGATASSGSAPTTAAASAAVTKTAPSTASTGAMGGSQLDWAKRQIGKYDLNGDGQLTANEWEKMIIKPTGADANGDGVITADEYAAFRAK